MSIDGIWASEIHGIYGWESMGILAFQAGQVIGGGNNHYAVGTYKTNDDDIKVRLSAHYFGSPRTIFGESQRDISIRLKGSKNGDTVSGEVRRSDRPKVVLATRLTKLSDLPSAKPAD